MTASLSSPRLTLDEPNAGDIEALYRYCTDPEILRWIPLPDPFEHIHAEYFVNTFVPDGREQGTRAQWAEALLAVADHVFDTHGRALVRLDWEAMIGNDASAHVARNVSFRFEGTARRSIIYHGERRDGWQASLLPGDERRAQRGWPPESVKVPRYH